MKNQTCQTCGAPSFGKNCRVCFAEPEPLEEKFWRQVRKPIAVLQ